MVTVATSIVNIPCALTTTASTTVIEAHISSDSLIVCLQVWWLLDWHSDFWTCHRCRFEIDHTTLLLHQWLQILYLAHLSRCFLFVLRMIVRFDATHGAILLAAARCKSLHLLDRRVYLICGIGRTLLLHTRASSRGAAVLISLLTALISCSFKQLLASRSMILRDRDLALFDTVLHDLWSTFTVLIWRLIFNQELPLVRKLPCHCRLFHLRIPRALPRPIGCLTLRPRLITNAA